EQTVRQEVEQNHLKEKKGTYEQTVKQEVEQNHLKEHKTDKQNNLQEDKKTVFEKRVIHSLTHSYFLNNL
ncbi:hypothetical protein M153_26410001976, partial [Pseudoloma neurophilia]